MSAVGVDVLLGDGVGVIVGDGVKVGIGVSVAVALGVWVGNGVGVFVGVNVNKAEDEAVLGPSSKKVAPHEPVTHKTNKTKIASGKISFLNMNFSYLLQAQQVLD